MFASSIENGGERDDVGGDLRVIRAESLFPNRHRSSRVQLAVVEAAAQQIEDRNTMQNRRDLRMVGSIRVLRDREGICEQTGRLLEATRVLVEHSHVVE